MNTEIIMTRETRAALDYAFAFVGVIAILAATIFGEPDVRKVSIGVLIGLVGTLIRRTGQGPPNVGASSHIVVGQHAVNLPKPPGAALALLFVALAVLTVTNPAFASLLDSNGG